MVKEELFNKKKEEYIKSNRKIAIAFFLTNIFFTLLWVISGFTITSNNLSKDTGPIIVFIFVMLTLISLVTGIVMLVMHKKTHTGKVEYFIEEEKINYIPSFLTNQIIYSNVLLVGILIVLIGIALRGDLGIQIASIGLAVAGLAISFCIYYRIIRKSYLVKKSNVVNDVIKEKSLYYSTSIIERVVYVIFIIAIIIMAFNLIINYQSTFNKILLFVSYVLFIGYNLYIELKCLKKHNSKKN